MFIMYLAINFKKSIYLHLYLLVYKKVGLNHIIFLFLFFFTVLLIFFINIIRYIFLYIVNFLDMTLNLSDNTYKTFLKIYQYPSYINVNSNPPMNIIKQVPKAVKLRIKNLSANEKIFQESSKIYKDALKKKRV